MRTLVSQQPFPTTECKHFKIFAKFHFFIIEAELFFISHWPLVFLILQIVFIRYAFAARKRKIWLTMMETNRGYFTSLQKLILSVDSAAHNVNDKVSANLMASHSWWQDGCTDPASHPCSRQDRKKNKAAIFVPSKNPPREDFCLCPIGQNYDTWPPQPQRRLEKMICFFQPL